MTLLRLAHILRLGLANPQLHRIITIHFRGPRGDNPHLIEMQNRDRHVRPIILEQPGHPQLFRNHTGTHHIT